MNQTLQEIMKKSTFSVIDGWYCYAKVRSVDPDHKHFMVTRDEDEITVVTNSEHVPNLDLIEKNKDRYHLVALNVSVPFYSVGFLAAVTEAIANKGLNILVISTYSKDYILIREGGIEKAIEVLIHMGMSREN